jgi:hypothetical protein
MKEVSLNFKLTEVEGNYGILFQDSEPIGFAMFNKEDYSLAVAFKKNNQDRYQKGDILASIFIETDNFYGMNNYHVTENNSILEAHYSKFLELNSKLH